MYALRCKIDHLHGTSLTSCVQIHPNGKILATASTDKTIRLWSIDDENNNDANSESINKKRKGLTYIRTLEGHSKGINYICFSPNGKYLASASDDLTIRIWSIEFGNCIKILKGHTYCVNFLKFNYKSTILISGSSDENIRIWDIIKGKCLKILSAHSDPVSCIDLSYDGTVIVSGSYDGLIRLFDLETGQCLKTLIDDKRSNNASFPISYVKFSPNCKFILSSSLGGSLQLWDYMNNKVVKTYLLDEEESKDGNEVENKTDNTEVENQEDDTIGQLIASKFSCSTDFITLNKEKISIITGSEHGKIFIFDLQSKKLIDQLQCSSNDNENEPILQTDIYQEGKLLAAISRNGTLTIWDYVL